MKTTGGRGDWLRTLEDFPGELLGVMETVRKKRIPTQYDGQVRQKGIAMQYDGNGKEEEA